MLAVEVVSSSDTDHKSRARAYAEKRAEYAERGIPEYWIIEHPVGGLITVCTLENPAYQNTVFRGDRLIASPTLPTLNLTAAQILAVGLRSMPALHWAHGGRNGRTSDC